LWVLLRVKTTGGLGCSKGLPNFLYYFD